MSKIRDPPPAYREIAGNIEEPLKYDSCPARNNFYHRHGRLNIQGNPFDSSARLNIQRFRSFVRSSVHLPARSPLHPPPLISGRAFTPIPTL